MKVECKKLIHNKNWFRFPLFFLFLRHFYFTLLVWRDDWTMGGVCKICDGSVTHGGVGRKNKEFSVTSFMNAPLCGRFKVLKKCHKSNYPFFQRFKIFSMDLSFIKFLQRTDSWKAVVSRASSPKININMTDLYRRWIFECVVNLWWIITQRILKWPVYEPLSYLQFKLTKSIESLTLPLPWY